MCKIAIIGGCGSSGTTLLCHLLNAHPNIYCGPELYVFDKRQLYSSSFSYAETSFDQILSEGLRPLNLLGEDMRPLSTYKEPSRNFKDFLRDLPKHGLTREVVCRFASDSLSFHEFVSYIRNAILERAQKQYWVEKTPRNCYCIGEFLSCFPDGKYIHVVRDGRDVVQSLMNRGFTPEQATRRWMHDTATCLPYRNHDRCFILRYEDLVSSPKSIFNKLLWFLGESGNVEKILKQAKHQPISDKTHDSWNQQPNQGISSVAVEKWKKDSYLDKRFLEQLFCFTKTHEIFTKKLKLSRSYNANDVLDAFGYDNECMWNTRPSLGMRFFKHFLSELYYRPRFRYKPLFDVVLRIGCS
jgi:hypothetical protein